MPERAAPRYDLPHMPDMPWEEMSRIEQLSILPEEERALLLAELTEDDLHTDLMTLRPKQLDVVNSPAWITAYMGGRGSGKTKTGARWVNKRAKENPGCIIALLGRTVADVRDVMIQGESGIIAESDPDFMPAYTPSLRKLVWPNGSTAFTYTSDAPNQLRGPQQHFLWADELAAFRMVPDDSGATAWDNALFSTRLGDLPQLLITTTPKRVQIVRELFKQARDPSSGVVLYIASTLSNRANLSVEYLRAIYEKFAGTHLERQELHGELVGDSPGSLWRSDDIRVQPLPSLEDEPAGLMYIIGVDPSVTKHGDDTGIVVVASTKHPDILKRQAWVVADLTLNAGPDEWAPVVIQAQKEYSTPDAPAIIVVEGNQGGELLNLVLNQLSPGIPIAKVTAIRSKAARAEPVVMTYRQHRVHHAREFPELVDELTGWEPDVSRWSPGHLDALVWALHTLLVDPKPLWPFAPVLVGSDHTDISIRGAIPAHRRERGRGPGAGMAIAPWRHRSGAANTGRRWLT
jgi:phage terminase large subunit-like protein